MIACVWQLLTLGRMGSKLPFATCLSNGGSGPFMRGAKAASVGILRLRQRRQRAHSGSPYIVLRALAARIVLHWRRL